jgi:hypothetical protein
VLVDAGGRNIISTLFKQVTAWYTFSMHEKPQYPTPGGFNRLSKNSYVYREALFRLALQKKRKRDALVKRSMGMGRGAVISDEAAAAIARVLKEMLKDHR